MSDVYERLFNLSSELMATVDAAGRFVHLNAAWERALGWTTAELKAAPFAEFVHPDDREGHAGAAAKVLGGSEGPFEHRFRAKDGSYRWVAGAVSGRKGDELTAIVGRDVTESRRSEGGAAAAIAAFEAIFRGLSDFAAILDPRGRVLFLNPAGQQLLGREFDNNAGLSVEQVAAPGHAARLVGEYIPTAISAGGWEGEGELRQRDGTGIPVSQVLAPVRDATGRVVALATVARDLGEAARFEEELQRRFLQQEAIVHATSTPIIQVWDDIVTMPVVGLVDSVRAADMKTSLLEFVSRTGAKFAIVDLTGVDTVDTATADHILKVIKAVQLLGARCVISGIQPAVAQIIVGLGLDLQGVITLRSLREGLRFCLRRMGFRVQREAQPTLVLPGVDAPRSA